MTPKKINIKDRLTENGEIDLSMSDLQDVPVKDIAVYKKAHSLDLSNNHITILPKAFPSLTHLTKLDLSKNKVKELPENFGDLVRLKHLDLYQNQLEHLPLSFSKLKSLKWLDLKDNPLVPAVANVAGQCLDSKQCQTCARDIVAFFSKLQDKIDKEKDMREKQRRKQVEYNQQKLKEEKKFRKKDKVKQVAVLNGAFSEKSTHKEKNKKNKSKVTLNHDTSSKFSILIDIFISLVLVFILFFILTAVKVERVAVVENFAKDLYLNTLSYLPDNWKPYGKNVGYVIGVVHKNTGKVTLDLIRCIKSTNVSVLFENIANMGKNAVLFVNKFYNETFT